MRGLVAAVAAAGVAAGPATAAPCWQRVLTDWSDGTLRATYPVACYHAALTRLPEDLRIYSSAETDIERVLQAAALKARAAQKRTLAASAGDRAAAAAPAGSSLPVPLLVLAGLSLAVVSAAALSVTARAWRAARTPRRG